MIRTLLFISMICLVVSCNTAEKMEPTDNLTGNLILDIDNLLPVGEFEARVQGIKQPDRLNKLQNKYQGAIQNNREWFLKYMESHIDIGEGLPYHENFGLTQDEFDEMGELLKSLRYTTASRETITINRRDNQYFLSGRGSGNRMLEFYLHVKINADSNVASVINFDCLDSEYIEINDSDNALGSTWKGYKWRFETGLDSFDSLNAKRINFTLGRLDSTGERYLGLKIRVIENGQKVLDNMMTILL